MNNQINIFSEEKIKNFLYSNSNTFYVNMKFSSIQYYILHIILYYVNCVNENEKKLCKINLYNLCSIRKFNYVTFIKRYAIQTYFNKQYTDIYFLAILSYFKDNLYLLDSSSVNKKLIRYIAYKLENRQKKTYAICLNEKNKFLGLQKL